MEVEVWMLAATVVVAVVPWAMSIHAKVAVIAHAVEALPQIVDELREALQEHEHRLERHDAEIAALQKATGPRH
jgi:Tfp pilus assembly protein FimV